MREADLTIKDKLVRLHYDRLPVNPNLDMDFITKAISAGVELIDFLEVSYRNHYS